MPRKHFIPKDDIAPRQLDIQKKPALKLYDEYEEEMIREGDTWVLHGFFGDREYWIPIRTKYRFGAHSARYRLLLKAERDKADPNTGQIFPGDNRSAQFSEGEFHTRDMFVVRGLYRSNAMDGGRIWDKDTEESKMREQHYQGLKGMLLDDEAFKKRFLDELREEVGVGEDGEVLELATKE